MKENITILNDKNDNLLMTTQVINLLLEQGNETIVLRGIGSINSYVTKIIISHHGACTEYVTNIQTLKATNIPALNVYE